MAEQEIKRLNYFTGQFLKEQEFKDEQKYHLHMRRRINYILFETSGVIPVNPDDLTFDINNTDNTFRVKAGMAVCINHSEKEAKEIILTEDTEYIDCENQKFWVTLNYEEVNTETSSEGGVTGETRTLENAVVQVHSTNPGEGEDSVILGAIEPSSTSWQANYDDRQEAKIRASLIGAAPVTPVPTSELVSINITPESPLTVTEDGYIDLTATGTFSEGPPIPLSRDDVTWESDNKDVATVNSNGRITGVSDGSANITATSTENTSIRDTVEVTVTPATPAVPAPLIQSDPQFNPTSGRPNNDVTIFGSNFGVDLPHFPTVTLIPQNSPIPPIEVDVTSVSHQTTPETIVFKVPEIQDQASSVDMLIQVSTSGEPPAVSTWEFRWRPPL